MEIPLLLYFLLGVSFKVKVKVTLRLAVYRQSVRLGVKPLETHDQIFFFPLNSCGNSLSCCTFLLYNLGSDLTENKSIA
jgi:hypothetical protein